MIPSLSPAGPGLDEAAAPLAGVRVEDHEPSSGDARVITVIGIAHGVSHFFHLLVSPLFPWLMADFGLSFVGVGVTMTLFFTVSAIGQAAAGFAVDRFGALRVLYFGMACFAIAAVGVAGAMSPGMLYAAAALAGLGNSVFHPADFSVLNQRVSLARLGHAFSVHGVCGNLGWAAAPAFVVGIATYRGWRVAALAAAGVALVALLLLWLNRRVLYADRRRSSADEGGQGPFAFLAIPAVWLCFVFLFLITSAFGAIQNFAVPVLRELYGFPLGLASTTLSAYLLAAAGGVLVGGFLARREASERVVAAALCTAALLAAVIAATVVPAFLVPPLMAAVGFFTGISAPSRDLLVRRAATSRFGNAAYGRIYGFVYSGLDTGLALAPLVFGGFMNRGLFASVLVGVAVLQGLAILAALLVGRGLARVEEVN